jgi:hypothetical protein
MKRPLRRTLVLLVGCAADLQCGEGQQGGVSSNVVFNRLISFPLSVFLNI